MSKFLEGRVRRRLEIAYEEESKRLDIPLTDVQKCPSLTLRQVSCTDKTHHVCMCTYVCMYIGYKILSICMIVSIYNYLYACLHVIPM